ncbi:hypothetical protein D3C73_1418050 [compost metagenome]
MGYYCTMADEQSAHGALAQAVRQLYDEASQAGLGQSPVPVLIDSLGAEPDSLAGATTRYL